MNKQYNIVMFAYNEQDNIEQSVTSVFRNIDERLNRFYVIANGCSDLTVQKANEVKKNLNFRSLSVIELEEGDKCNAWNHYMHTIADDSEVHFFVDADVKFTENSFPLMFDKLTSKGNETVVIAGMPQSGRNIAFYRSLVIDRACFFGNLYGMKHSFIRRIRENGFYLPKGLNWIDSFLTKAVNTDLEFFNYNLPNRTTYLESTGYFFDSLSPFNKSDIKLYFNRIARYELGKFQETYLDAIPVNQWPQDMTGINKQIKGDFAALSGELSLFKKYLVRRRLNKLLKKAGNN